jgi:hypothetical protein
MQCAVGCITPYLHYDERVATSTLGRHPPRERVQILSPRFFERSSPSTSTSKGFLVVNAALAPSGRWFNGVPYLLKEQANFARLLTGFEPG